MKMVADQKWSEDMIVRVVSKEMVMPAHPTPRHTMFLPSLDIMWQDVHYNRRLIFYEGTADASEQAVMEKLKSSLAACLVHYYPWCGRIAGPRDRLVIDCNDAGVEFVQAHAHHVPLRQLEEQGYQINPFFEKLCPQSEHRGNCLFSSPLLSIQATLFSDNGLALGFAQSHIVADGQALWNFMVSWGECARGISPLSMPPVLNRERLALTEPASASKAKTNIEVMLRREEDDEEEDMKAREKKKEAGGGGGGSAMGGHGEEEEGEPNKLVQCVFNLPYAAIKKLKEEAGGRFSSYEVICAHFWKHVTMARGVGDDEATTNLCVLANCRSRLQPPLPSTYFGNVIMFSMATTTTAEIRAGTLSCIAEHLHKAIAACREDTLLALVHWLELHGNRLMPSISWQGQYMNVASSPRFPLYQVDFGWGQPAAVRSVKILTDGEIVLGAGSPRLRPGDVEICCALSQSSMKRLLEDPHFLPKPVSYPLHQPIASQILGQ